VGSTDRPDRVVGRLEVDALLVTNLVNVRYLTGFTGSNGLCVLGPGLRRFVTDFRYLERAADEVEGFEIERAPQEFLAALGAGWDAGPLRLGFEDDALTVRQHRRIAELLPDAVELVPAGGAVEAERALKDDGELAAIAAAAALADAALSATLERGLTGRTERAVALDLEGELRARGAEPAFGSIVASGVRGASPHATPTDAVIETGVLVTIDWGARLGGYCSDCTRTFATGALPGDLRAIYDLVQHAQAEAAAAVRPGPTGAQLDAVAREIITTAGHGEHFGHGLGHGVGLEVHEAPRAGRGSDAVLAETNVVTVEPGVYVPGTGGVRIEDLVVVTATGSRSLSGLAKDLEL
jgi:Xaa-Pro aminopeptidase